MHPATDPKKKSFSWFDKETVSLSEALAQKAAEIIYSNSVKDCPVCGVESMVVVLDSMDVEDDEGNVIGVHPIPYKLRYYCCSFEIYQEFGELKTLGLPVGDLWQE